MRNLGVGEATDGAKVRDKSANEKPEIIVLSKVDVLEDEAQVQREVAQLRAALRLGRGEEILAISAAQRHGIRPLLEAAWAMLKAPAPEAPPAGALTPE